MTKYSELGTDKLLMNADTQGFGSEAMQLLKVAEIKLRQEHRALLCNANELSNKLLLSNEQASKQSENNAELMNKATQELAESTKSLKWATWALVGFTAV